ncbi:MAG: hypothetical protein MI922_16490 [Bacteroidales bacterium]|nr:hypothetical protein [Bacteroidales bacterium]
MKISGGINAGLSAYSATGGNARRDPYSWNASANINFNVCGVIDLPFSATFSKGSQVYNRPMFKKVGVSPKYKWLTLHAGYRNMMFSSYTLSGITFLGGGFEIAPKPEEFPISFKFLYGQFAKGIDFKDEQRGILEEPSYERHGWGGMITYQHQGNSVDLIMFKASDKKYSVNIPDSLQIKPKENLVIGFNTNLRILKIFQLKTEYALSAFTDDIRNEEIFYDKFTYYNNLGGLFTPRESSSVANAYTISLNAGFEHFTVGGNYQRVSPNYQSLGTTYISNNFENYLLNGSTSIFKKRVSLSGNYGLQKNNLDKMEESTTLRKIGGFQLSWAIRENLSVSSSVSNFTTNTTPTLVELIDSVKVVQVAKNYTFLANFTPRTDGALGHNINVNFAHQVSDMLNNTATEVQESNTVNNNAVLTYSLQIKPWTLSTNWAVSYSEMITEMGTTQTIGPVFSTTRSFFKNKLRTNLAISDMISNGNGSEANILMTRVGCSYTLYKKHQLKLNCSVSRNHTVNTTTEMQDNLEVEVDNTRLMTEMRAMLNYSYNF